MAWKKLNRKKMQFWKRLSLLDMTVIAITAIMLLGFLLFFMRKTEEVTIRVRVTDQDALFAWANPPSWYAHAFTVGDEELDSLGRTLARITAVEQIDVTSNTKAVYLDMKVRSTYDSRTKRYTFKGKNLSFGTPIRFTLRNVFFDAIIVGVPHYIDPFPKVTLKVFAIGYNIQTFLASQVEQYSGKSLYSNSDKLYLTIDKVTVSSAGNVYQFTDLDNIMIRESDDYRDISIELTIYAKKTPFEYFAYEDVPIKVGEMLPISFPEMTFFPTVTSIQEITE